MGPGETFVALGGMVLGFFVLRWGVELAKRAIAFQERKLEIESGARVMGRFLPQRKLPIAAAS